VVGRDKLAGGDSAWLIIDNTALSRKGRHSVDIAPRYASALGKTANCQSLVSMTLASCEVAVMVGLQLFMPESWTNDPGRMTRAHVPWEANFRFALTTGASAKFYSISNATRGANGISPE